MKTLAVVPARSGSKGLPGKNARPFLGVPLLVRAIQIGLETCDDVVVTTDSPELAALAYPLGVPVRMRPAELATDEAPMLPVVQDAIRGREGDVIVLLQPTQPLRTAEQVRQALALLDDGADSVVTVRAIPQAYLPDRALILGMDGTLYSEGEATVCHGPRRQDARDAYYRDGTAYVTWRRVIEADHLYGYNCRPLILQGEGHSIDTLEDFELLEALANA